MFFLNGYFLLVSCILGLVEGLTEFLPVSSTLHIFFVGNLLGFNDDNREKFFLNVILQLGAILSVIVVFWNEVSDLLVRTMCFRNFVFFGKSCLCFGHIILGVLPIFILGLVFYEDIRSFYKVKYMLYSFFLGAILLLVAEWFSCKFYIFRKNVSNLNDLSYIQAFFIGCFQCLSLCPGFSRSGATISGGLLVGVSRYVASTFSFLLAIPVMFGAVVLVLYKNFFIFVWKDIFVFILGFIVAFIVSFFTVKIFMKIIQYVSFIPFAIYRFILAVLIYIFYEDY